MMSDLEILYQDESLVAVNKPSGLLVHRSNIDRHETVFAVQKVRDQIGQRVYPVHRLDKPTSGVLLFALDSNMARQMTDLLMASKVQKRYLAVVRGYASLNETIDYPLVLQWDKMTGIAPDQVMPVQDAVTGLKRLATAELPYAVGRYSSSRYSLVRLAPVTGRKHQLRRHMKHIFHPILGDTTYGDGRHNRFFRQHFDCHRLLLAATNLAFVHPLTGLTMEIRAPLDTVFNRVIEGCGWELENGKGVDGSSMAHP